MGWQLVSREDAELTTDEQAQVEAFLRLISSIESGDRNEQ